MSQAHGSAGHGAAGHGTVSHPPMAVEHHPQPATYFKIALTLAFITIVEVGLFYLNIGKGLFVTVLLVLSAVKFAMVVLFYMHLRFDNKLFASLFTGGLAIAASMMLALLALFSIRH